MNQKINEVLAMKENYLGNIFSDVRTVQQLAKVDKISKIRIFVSLPWKFDFFNIVKSEIDADNRDFKIILGKVMSNDSIKQNGKEVTKMLPMLLKKGLPEYMSLEDEFNILNDSIDSIETEFNCDVEVIKAQDSEESKAKQATPGKPAILIE
jgi:leucyl-tRNA synthetase